jgi:hypothetical protein
MTFDEIQELVNKSVSEQLSSFKEEITSAHKGLAASLTKEFKKSVQSLQSKEDTAVEDKVEDTQQKLSLKALESQLSELKKQLEEKDKDAFLAKRSSALSQAISQAKALNPTALQKLFTLEYGEKIKEEGGQWYIEKEDKVVGLNEALADYLNSPEGKFYLPPSNITGAGSETIKSNSVGTSQQGVDAKSALYEAFSNY